METGINVVILIAGSFGMCVGAYALNRSRRKQPAAAEPAGPTQSAPDELELLRYENAMLRSEQQRSLSLGKAGERARVRLGDELGGSVETPASSLGTMLEQGPHSGLEAGPTSGTDEGDDAWTALTEATVLRDAMLTVCRDVQAAMRNVEVQLSSGVPITELDRRRTDRGQHSPAAGTNTHTGDADHTVTLPDHVDLSVAPMGQETGI